MSECPFCHPEAGRIFHAGQLVLGLWDGFPVADGHALLIPKRHVATWFEASAEVQRELTDAIAVTRRMIEERRTSERKEKPDGYNIGMNVGESAGQTVFHLHIHVIPRYRGDVPDPRGGIRHVLPCKGNYLAGHEHAERSKGSGRSPASGTMTGTGKASSNPRLIAIDWSGAKTGARRKIWLAEVVNGQMIRLENGHSREEITDLLIDEARKDPCLVVGLDFAFSLPSWFLARHNLTTARAVWDRVERDGEGWLSKCAYPFWGRPGHRKPKLPAEFRRTEQTAPSITGIRPKSVFQIGGAGAVGTGSLRGMPILGKLQDAGFAIWPFHRPKLPVVIEIYPRLLTQAVSKTSDEARRGYLDRHHSDLPTKYRELAAQSEDAFDAAVSALIMSRHKRELLALPDVTDPIDLLEGRIWYPHPQSNALSTSKMQI